MAKIQWDKPGERLFEVGVDRGVLYPRGSYGVPWNGLVSVAQTGDGGSSYPYYIDGYKFYNDSTPEEFSGTIEAYTYPKEFATLNGDHTNGSGLYYGQQDREEFDLSYRTGVGSDTEQHLGYKIHLLYNVLAGPSSETYSTVSNSTDPMNFSWGITTRGVRVSGVRPTAELVIDTTVADPEKVSLLEDILYGKPGYGPKMPTQTQVIELFDDWPYLELTIDRVTGINPLSYDGYKDLKGDVSYGIFEIPQDTRLSQDGVSGFYRIS